MDRRLVIQFRQRWQIVEDIERREYLLSDIEEILQQTASAMRLGIRR